MQEDTIYVPKHSTDGFIDEHVSDISDSEDEFTEVDLYSIYLHNHTVLTTVLLC